MIAAIYARKSSEQKVKGDTSRGMSNGTVPLARS
jgi:hypothetical protein